MYMRIPIIKCIVIRATPYRHQKIHLFMDGMNVYCASYSIVKTIIHARTDKY